MSQQDINNGISDDDDGEAKVYPDEVLGPKPKSKSGKPMKVAKAVNGVKKVKKPQSASQSVDASRKEATGTNKKHPANQADQQQKKTKAAPATSSKKQQQRPVVDDDANDDNDAEEEKKEDLVQKKKAKLKKIRHSAPGTGGIRVPHRFKPGTVAKWDAHRLSKTGARYLGRLAPVVRLINSILDRGADRKDLRMSKRFLDNTRTVYEIAITNMLRAAGKVCQAEGSTTLQANHLDLAMSILRDHSDALGVAHVAPVPQFKSAEALLAWVKYLGSSMEKARKHQSRLSTDQAILAAEIRDLLNKAETDALIYHASKILTEPGEMPANPEDKSKRFWVELLYERMVYIKQEKIDRIRRADVAWVLRAMSEPDLERELGSRLRHNRKRLSQVAVAAAGESNPGGGEANANANDQGAEDVAIADVPREEENEPMDATQPE